MNHRDSLDEANAKKLTETFNRVLETGEPEKSLSWTLITADGSLRFVESSISLIRDPRGQPTGFGGFLRDVTQRQRAEALYRAKLAAEAASRTKSEFLASMSHEIRTPLNAIIGLVELMLQSELSTDQREDLDVVKASAYSLLAIINNILDFSKIEAGKLEFDQTPFSLEHFIDETMKIMAMKAHEKGIELAARIAPGVPDRLLGDPTRLRQVLLNLVDNAIKFTRHGEVMVFVAAQDRTKSEVILHISVVDTGIGIAPDKQRSIFGAYHQALHQRIELVFHRRFCAAGERNAFSSLFASYLHMPEDIHLYLRPDSEGTPNAKESDPLAGWVAVTQSDHLGDGEIVELPRDRELTAAEHRRIVEAGPMVGAGAVHQAVNCFLDRKALKKDRIDFITNGKINPQFF
jgi:nitrogen-specific signal transduction histidine kinase